MDSIKLHHADKLTRLENGNFLYVDSYGESTEIDHQTIDTWLVHEGIEITPEVDAFISGPQNDYYAYGDGGAMDSIKAGRLMEAAEIYGIPTYKELADGAWLVVRNNDTNESIRIDIHWAIRKAFGRIEPEAIGTGTDADDNPDGSDDWNHPSAADARELTKALGMEWDFTTWADAQELATEIAGQDTAE
jgi:hypothetical protein